MSAIAIIITILNAIIFNASEKTILLSDFFSSENLKTASQIFSVQMGINSEIVVLRKSYVPYSSVVRIAVYNGTIKKLIILLPKLLIVNNVIFFNIYLYLLSYFLSSAFIY